MSTLSSIVIFGQAFIQYSAHHYLPDLDQTHTSQAREDLAQICCRMKVIRPFESPVTSPSSSIRKGKVSKSSEKDSEHINYLDKLRLLLPACRKSHKKLSHLDVIEGVIQYVRELQETLGMDVHAREMDLLEYQTSCITLAA